MKKRNKILIITAALFLFLGAASEPSSAVCLGIGFGLLLILFIIS